MKQIVDCSLFCFIAAALLGSMVYFLFTSNKDNKISQFLSRLTKEQQEVYRNISEERLNIFLMGFCIGLIVGIGTGKQARRVFVDTQGTAQHCAVDRR